MTARLIIGDCRESMRQLAAEGVRVQMCVTSPPYYGLRDYGHEGQLGLESTPDEYIAGMVEVFRCVRDVLADDGTLWVNIGDSYTGNSSSGGAGLSVNYTGDRILPKKGSGGAKPKDLLGIPWMLAFALRADGWYLRQDIIWAKPNRMPESVTDRCTKAHEYLFLLSKRERYYFDNDSIREDIKPWNNGEMRAPKLGSHHNEDPYGKVNFKIYDEIKGANRRSVWTIPSQPYSRAHFATYPPALIKPCILAGSRPGDVVLDPFMGSGTTGQVCQELGRGWIGCELNEAYKPLIEERTAQTGFVF